MPKEYPSKKMSKARFLSMTAASTYEMANELRDKDGLDCRYRAPTGQYIVMVKGRTYLASVPGMLEEGKKVQ